MKGTTILRILLVGVLIAIGIALAFLRPNGATSGPLGNNVLRHALDVEQGRARPSPHEAQLSSGAMYAVLQAAGVLEKRGRGPASGGASAQSPASIDSTTSTQGCQHTFSGAVNNIRVNQDCSLRRQAEEVIAVNPNDPTNLVAGQNDSRIGFNHCGYAWSFDGGATWGDQIPPFFQFALGDGHTADACSDPTATFDAAGNAYVGGIVFDVSAAANAFVVAKSNAGIGGQFYHSPKVQSFQTYRDLPLGVVASDNDPNIFNDKEFIVADAGATSPKKNNVYATWTRFNGATGAGVGQDSPIYFSQSTDGGATWSPGIEISGAASVCTDFSGEPNAQACDQDQGSHPIAGPDGTIYVSFFNGNTPNLGVNQWLLVKCPASSNCSNKASWTTPVKISDDIGKQPIGPAAATGCPAGRQCLPPNGYRVQDETYGSLSSDSSGKVYFAWADFRNGGGSCNWQNAKPGRAATATPPCDNDVFYAFSTNGGATWSAARNVTPASQFGANAQWQPWNAVSPDGSHLFIGYYDRHYASGGTTCEFTGCNDITLADVGSPLSGSPTFTYTRITTSSMPNLVVANNPLEAGFLGDYMWVTVTPSGRPKIVWGDTRGTGGSAVEEDIYYASP
jgi:hypothetical protein